MKTKEIEMFVSDEFVKDIEEFKALTGHKLCSIYSYETPNKIRVIVEKPDRTATITESELQFYSKLVFERAKIAIDYTWHKRDALDKAMLEISEFEEKLFGGNGE